MMKWTTAGESHGPALIGLIEGIPAGVELTTTMLEDALARRRKGYGRGARQKFEADAVRIISGVRHGKTLGSPIAIEVANSEWPKWQVVMNADPQDPQALMRDAGTGDEREISRNKRLTRPRPGHADLAGMTAYRQLDARNILERASARETAMRVAIGEVARQFLVQACGVEIVGYVRQIGSVTMELNDFSELTAPLSAPQGIRELRARLEDNDTRCPDPNAAAQMRDLIDSTKKSGDTLGGVVEVRTSALPVGLGSHTQWDQRLDGLIAQALMSIQSVKATAIGDGLEVAGTPGSAAHDEICEVAPASAHHQTDPLVSRKSNRAGGIEGGISNGAPLVARAWLKPISTVPRALRTIDLANGQAATALHQRSDVCAVVPAAVIAEAMVALTLAGALLERTGGGHLDRVRQALAHDDDFAHALVQGHAIAAALKDSENSEEG